MFWRGGRTRLPPGKEVEDALTDTVTVRRFAPVALARKEQNRGAGWLGASVWPQAWHAPTMVHDQGQCRADSACVATVSKTKELKKSVPVFLCRSFSFRRSVGCFHSPRPSHAPVYADERAAREVMLLRWRDDDIMVWAARGERKAGQASQHPGDQ